MDPLVQGHDKRSEIEGWKKRERHLIFAADEKCQAYEDRRQKWASDTLADFTTGDKQDRLQKMNQGDHR